MSDLTEEQLIVVLRPGESCPDHRRLRAALIGTRQNESHIHVTKNRMGRTGTMSVADFNKLRREVLKFYLIEQPSPLKPPTFKEERELDEVVAHVEFTVSIETDNRFT